MTREEAFKIAKKIGNSVPWHEDTVRLLEALGLIKFEKSVDWAKDLQITTHNGTFKVYNLGIGWKNKRIVQIEENSARYPSHDGSLPNVFTPDDNGYVVQFDTWIINA